MLFGNCSLDSTPVARVKQTFAVMCSFEFIESSKCCLKLVRLGTGGVSTNREHGKA